MKNNCLIFKPGDLKNLLRRKFYILLITNIKLNHCFGISAFNNAKKKFDIVKNSKKCFRLYKLK